MDLVPGHEKLLALEAELKKFPQAVCPVEWIHAPGVVLRKMTIPAGVALTGAVHKTCHANIVVRGRITVSDGAQSREIVGPCEFVSEAGTKRAGYAIEETVWITVHPNPTDSLDEKWLVETLTEAKFEDLLDVKQRLESTKDQIEGVV